jgi:copper oxidase (laccase) domain-containing protein
MKNIQVIDGAINCAYDIYEATAEDFDLIFPEAGQDIQFVEDLTDNEAGDQALKRLWKNRLNKKDVQGIHGTLFCELEAKKTFYPDRQETDLTTNRSRPQ